MTKAQRSTVSGNIKRSARLTTKLVARYEGIEVDTIQ